MNRQHIELSACAGEIISALPHGVLLTSRSGEKTNCMTIGWGMFGINWAEPMFTVFVRQGRFTRQLLDENPEFTVSIPPRQHDIAPLRLCGTRSGRDCDKIALSELTLTEPEIISVPAVAEYPLTLECRVVHRIEMPPESVHPDYQKFYPQDIGSEDCGRNRDFHVAYTGRIVSCYRLER